MAETIKKHKDIVCIFGIGLILAAVGMLILSGMIAMSNSASAATETIAVSATVEQSLIFSVSPTTTALSPALLDTGGGGHIGSSTDIGITVSTNWGSYQITASGTYAGLYNSTATADTLIETVSPTSTFTTAVDNDNYGLQATSTYSNVVQANYAYWGQDVAGEIPSSSAPTIISDTNTPGTVTSTLKILAECDGSQEPGQYTDTILLTCTGAP